MKGAVDVKVGGKTYQVNFGKKAWATKQKEKSSHEESIGITDHLEGGIYIKPGISIDETKATVLHELLHCMVWDIGLPMDKFWCAENDETEEALVSAWEPRLFALMKDNQDLFGWLMGNDPDLPVQASET